MLATLPVVALVAVFFGRYIRTLSKQMQDRIADSSVIVEETLQGIQNVKSIFQGGRDGPLWAQCARRIGCCIEGRSVALLFIIFAMFGVVVFIVWRAVHLRAEGLLGRRRYHRVHWSVDHDRRFDR